MEKLSKHIQLLSNEKYTLPYCNCLLIKDGINCLVDSSPPEEEMVYLQNTPIDLIVNSHGHSDHNSRNYNFPNAQVLLHSTEHDRVASGEAYLHAYGFDHFPDELVRSLYLEAVHYSARPADGELTDGQMITTGSVEFQVIHLPGHSGGHCGFIFNQEGFVFTADINPDTKPFYAMVDSDVDDFIESIEKLIHLQPDMLVAGHGKAVMTEKLPQRLAMLRDELYLREEKILNMVRRGKHTIREIAEEGITYDGRFPEPRRIFFLHECMMDWKHLERLERLGRVICIEGKYLLA
ncbi:MAG TPA: MBL fold metallo-hydrolase [Syntrophomonadaceae bacterium]|nr:MBL fold metallo-hydrolase [Syntrophomonadaceae bacterium]